MSPSGTPQTLMVLLTCCLCFSDFMCSTNFLGVLKWRWHTGQKGRLCFLHSCTQQSQLHCSHCTTSLWCHPCAYNLVLSGLSMSDDITAKMSLTGVAPALNVRPTPPEHKQGIEWVHCNNNNTNKQLSHIVTDTCSIVCVCTHTHTSCSRRFRGYIFQISRGDEEHRDGSPVVDKWAGGAERGKIKRVCRFEINSGGMWRWRSGF